MDLPGLLQQVKQRLVVKAVKFGVQHGREGHWSVVIGRLSFGNRPAAAARPLIVKHRAADLDEGFTASTVH